MNMILFAIMFMAVMVLLDLYIYRRFLTKIFIRHLLLVKVFIITLFMLQIIFVLIARFNLLNIALGFYYLFSLAIGITFMLFVMGLIYDLSLLLSKRVPFDQSRRQSIKMMFDITMLITTFSYMFNAIYNGLKKPYINRVAITIENLHDLKIAQLSDMHIGQFLQKEFVKWCVDAINREKVDMVVITGDLLDGDIDTLITELLPLKQLKSRYGTFYVNGNHEYYHGASRIMHALRSLDITVLDDTSVTIENRFNVIGLNDLAALRFQDPPLDIEKAFSNVDSSLPSIVLAHQPKMTQLLQHKSYDLMLSGHTHGGQIFPFGFLVLLQQPYLAGLYRVDQSKQIFVSRGTGFWGPPVRFLAPSEISVLTIV